MAKPIALSKRWVEYLLSLLETGMGYQVVSVFLTDGRKFEQVVADSGYIEGSVDIKNFRSQNQKSRKSN